MIKLLIADDHSFFVQGVTLSLADTNIEVLGHVTDVNDVIDSFVRLRPDILLTDIMFGQERDGFDILKDLLAIDPNAKVILLSQYDQDRMIKQAYKDGAKAFLSKSIARDDLITAIETVARGDLYFTPENAIRLARMAYNKNTDERPLEEILTEKEIEVLKLLSDGFTEKEVAAKQDVSVKTIANIKASIKEKLNVERNSSLTKIALRHKLITWDDLH